MRFLSNSDYRFKISAYDFQTLLHDDDQNTEITVFDAEIKAQETISLYLRRRYDLQDLFYTYPEYASGQTYLTGDTVWYNSSGNSYLYSPSVTTIASPSSPDWYLVEPRNAMIIDWMITIVLYKLHERVSPDNIPTHRKDAYVEVMKLLKLVQEEKLNPDFAEVENRKYSIYITGKESSGIDYLY